MTREAFVENVLNGGDHGIGASLLRGLLRVFAFLHRVGLEIYLLPFHLGIRKRYRLPVPVIAVGNLSSGGTGKTPMTIRIVRFLQQVGLHVVVLSRGHGGTGESRATPRLVSDGETVLLTPAEAGDEPVLLARSLPGVPVVVCRDRRKSGRLAVERFQPDVIVCDDALQYWQLHRDPDIVLLDTRRPFDNGHVLPRGLLREPPEHLSRAGIVVLTRADRVSDTERQERIALVGRYTKAPIFTATHEPVDWVRASDGGTLPLETFAGQPVLAVSGIADGNAFADSVRRLGADLVANLAFGDHHRYTRADLDRVAAMANVPVAVTTEKDLVKIAPLLREGDPAFHALRIGMKIDNETAFLAALRPYLPATAGKE
ncbi:MAG: tetraacyldisaccharide 4'-kinase [Capsulimonadales bacterium]|nr:tetraacyldisaccharide 4'-kinase [Capsulimonadales bacterium]